MNGELPRPKMGDYRTPAELAAAERDWVKTCGMEAPGRGAHVEFSQPGSKERFAGEVMANSAEGRSRVCCEAFDHKPEKGHGFWVEWERLQVVPQAQELAI